jgi:hypothetical protein|nr:ferritin-like domain-containing protein [Kofleriaceae bacterium]
MTSTSLRVRLAIALGLPLAPGCGPSTTPPPATPPIAPGSAAPGSAASGSAASGSAATATPAGACPADQVPGHVCGVVTIEHSEPTAGAPPPLDHCPANAAVLDDLEETHVLDGWRMDNTDPRLPAMKFSQAMSAAYVVNNGVREGMPRCCYTLCEPLAISTTPRTKLAAGTAEYEDCVPTPSSASHPAASAPQCPAALKRRLFYPYGAVDPLDDARFVRATDTECCYMVATTHRCPPNTFETATGCESPNPGGRPLRDGGELVVAAVRPRAGWADEVHALPRSPSPSPSPSPSLSPSLSLSLSPAAQTRASAAWAREAAFEHASVAAFARLSLELMALGAPADLVDAAHAAARDEIRHARACYGLASELGGVAVGPGPLPVVASSATTLEELAVACFRDGCVNETVAALAVADGARAAGSPAFRATLSAIADDEAGHAELSYRILAWTLADGGAPVRAAIARELAAVVTELAAPAPVPATHPDHDPRLGLVSPAAHAALRRRVLADVVVPCTSALLAT